MKKLFASILTIAALAANAVTPFYQQGFNSDGAPQTNYFVLTAYPPAVNGVTIIGTNVIFGVYSITNQPNASGFVSNSIYGGKYKYTVPALNFSTYADIPETTNYNSLALYLTNSPVVAPFGGYAIITNLLGFAPAPATYAGITNALGFAPATNTPTTNTLVYIASITGTTNATGGITNFTYTLGTNVIYYQQR